MTTADDLTFVKTSRNDTEKVDALHRVAASDDPEVLDVLLGMAQDPSLTDGIGNAVGGAIAQIHWRQGRVNDAPFYLFTEAVGEGFDAAVARLVAPSSNDSSETPF